MDSATQEFYEQYVSTFFYETESFEENEVFYSYHIQEDSPPGTNPLASKNPELFKSLRAMRVNFDNEIAADSSVDPLHHLYGEEARLRKKAKEAGEPDLAVNRDVIAMLLDNIAGLPRNEKSHNRNRHAIGGYLYGKVGRTGLLSHMQSFLAERPKFGDPTVVSA